MESDATRDDQDEQLPCEDAKSRRGIARQRDGAKAQRKYRDSKERGKIAADVYRAWADLRIPETSTARAALIDDLNKFITHTDGYVFAGFIAVPELGRQLEYVLPGRRIMRHFVRLVKPPEE